MSFGFESTDFTWMDPAMAVPSEARGSESPSQFLKEGYLHVMEKLPSSKNVDSASTLGRAMSLVRRLSDPAILVCSVEYA